MQWDSLGDHSADPFGFPSSDESPASNEEGDASFNIEGLCATERGTLFLGFRSPLVDPLRKLRGGSQLKRSHAIVVELANQDKVLDSGNAPEFGRSFELDLGGRGIRDMSFNGNTYLILAGRVTPLGVEDDFALFTWKPGLAPILRFADFPTGLYPEGIAKYPAGDHYTPSDTDSFTVRMLSDDGPTDTTGNRTVSGTFRSFDAAVLPKSQMFQFDEIPALVLPNQSLGRARRVRLAGLTGVPSGQSATLEAAVVSGPTLVSGLSVTQPGNAAEPWGAIEFTPVGTLQSSPATAVIRIKATLPAVGSVPQKRFYRDFSISNFSAYQSYEFSTTGFSAAPADDKTRAGATVVTGTGMIGGGIAGSPEAPWSAFSWDRLNSKQWPFGVNPNSNPPSPSASSIFAMNDFGIAGGNEGYVNYDDSIGELKLWPASQGATAQGWPVSMFQNGNQFGYYIPYISINNTGGMVISNAGYSYYNRLMPGNVMNPASISVNSQINIVYKKSNNSDGSGTNWGPSAGTIAQCLSENGSISGVFLPYTYPSTGAEANYVWEQPDLQNPYKLPLEANSAVNYLGQTRISASGLCVGLGRNGSQNSDPMLIRLWKRGSSGWAVPQTQIQTIANGNLIGMTYHGQILIAFDRSYFDSGKNYIQKFTTELIDAGVSSGSWISFKIGDYNLWMNSFSNQGLILLPSSAPANICVGLPSIK